MTHTMNGFVSGKGAMFAPPTGDGAAIRARIAELERQNADLLAANNRYLERARIAERIIAGPFHVNQAVVVHRLNGKLRRGFMRGWAWGADGELSIVIGAKIEGEADECKLFYALNRIAAAQEEPANG